MDGGPQSVLLARAHKGMVAPSRCVFAQMWIGLWLVAQPAYLWGPSPDAIPLLERTPAPVNAARAPAEGFGAWLRSLPTKPGHPAVHLYDGRQKRRQDVHALVLDLDVGAQDLQQCADAVIRLRAEYLWATGRAEELCFRFTSGHPAWWRDYAAGRRPQIQGQRVTWEPFAAPDNGRGNFRRYLDLVFTYAGTRSLAKELRPVRAVEVRPGDVWLQGGAPGHAVLVVDVARWGDRNYLMLAQSYMPAQEVHVLKAPDGGVWFEHQAGQGLRTPEWDFGPRDLFRFEDRGCPPWPKSEGRASVDG